MEAWSVRHYGGPEVLCLEDVAAPTPGPGQVLVRVHATTVNSADVRVRACDIPRGMKTIGRLALGWSGPRQPILGTELAGIVVSAGQGVSRFRPGDAVYAFPGGRMGCHAQYVVVPESRVAPLPQGLDFGESAALCFGGVTALHYLRQAALKPGETVLVLGGSGAVGLAMIQLARHQNAVVTATSSARNLDLIADFGVARDIDYAVTSLSEIGERFDIVADTVGTAGFVQAQAVLKPGGRYLSIAGTLKEMLGAMRKGANDTRMIAGPSSERPDDIAELGRLASTGHYRPHIDRTFTWSEMPAAHAYVETKRKRGSVVVQVAE